MCFCLATTLLEVAFSPLVTWIDYLCCAYERCNLLLCCADAGELRSISRLESCLPLVQIENAMRIKILQQSLDTGKHPAGTKAAGVALIWR